MNMCCLSSQFYQNNGIMDSVVQEDKIHIMTRKDNIDQRIPIDKA